MDCRKQQCCLSPTSSSSPHHAPPAPSSSGMLAAAATASSSGCAHSSNWRAASCMRRRLPKGLLSAVWRGGRARVVGAISSPSSSSAMIAFMSAPAPCRWERRCPMPATPVAKTVPPAAAAAMSASSCAASSASESESEEGWCCRLLPLPWRQGPLPWRQAAARAAAALLLPQGRGRRHPQSCVGWRAQQRMRSSGSGIGRAHAAIGGQPPITS